LALTQNKPYIEGEGNIKYTFNNGFIAKEPKLAVEYFIHALEKIPTLIENHEKKNADLSKVVPVLQSNKTALSAVLGRIVAPNVSIEKETSRRVPEIRLPT
jgi:hypothetical protein